MGAIIEALSATASRGRRWIDIGSPWVTIC
jgi:hypothetical protein